MKPQDKVFVVIGTVAVMTVAGFTGYTLFTAKDSKQTKSTNATNTVPVSSSNTPTNFHQSSGSASSVASYKDGAYDATQSYTVPHGDTNSVDVKLIVAGGKITEVSTNHNYQSQESAQYTDWFDQEIKSVVIGRSLDDVSVSRVGGASLTSAAFNNVLDTVRNDAKT